MRSALPILYRVRPATVDDLDIVVHHRLAMFGDMGVEIDAAAVGPAFRAWLLQMMPAGVYHGWVVETPTEGVVAGGGLTVIPWPPGPKALGDRLAFVYNVFTEPPHRRRGLARLIMEAIHDWCLRERIGVVALNASPQARQLYESLGYTGAPSPMMVRSAS
jgi:GNAT superfamily N-acetyltransferase